MQPLFLEPTLEFTKLSAQTQLSEDPNAWPQELLQELYKQAPYVSDFSPHVVMEKVEGEQGYGLGHVEIGNQTEVQTATSPSMANAAGLRTVRIPIVIKDGMLYPLDLLVTDNAKVLPLTEVRLRAAIFRPQAFDVTSRTPGDQSMIGQLYPPYRQSYGFGGSGVAMNAGMGKEGSALERYLVKTAAEHCAGCDPSTCKCACDKCKTACAMKTGSFQSETDFFLTPDYLHQATQHQTRLGKKVASGEARVGMIDELLAKTASAVGTSKTASLLEAILPTINEADLLAFKRDISSPELEPLLYKNAAAVTPAIELLLTMPERPKFAEHFGSLVRPTVTQLRRTDEGYQLKTASHHLWAPATRTIDRAEALRLLGEKVVLAADLSGAATLSEGSPEVGHIADPEHDTSLQGAGPITEAGLYKVQTPDGDESVGYVIPNLLDIDGTPLPLALFTNGTQAIVQGDIVGVPEEGAPMDLPTAPMPSGRGVFASEGPDGVKATVPLTISARASGFGEGEPDIYRAESFTGEDVLVSCQPNIQTVVGTEDGKMLVPDSWHWVPLGHAEPIALESQEDGLGKAAQARRQYASIDVVSSGNTFSVRGPLVEKLAHDDREMLSLDETMFLLTGFGVKADYGVNKLAQAMTGLEPVRVRVGRTIKLAADEAAAAQARAKEKLAMFPQLKQQCFKEAAAIGDPTAVDTVLSLGFLNPENLMTFVGYLPSLEDAQAKLCDVLLASRLGNLLDTPEGATERAVRSLEAVLEGLKALAFQNN